MRTFAGPGLLAARGRIGGRPRVAVLLAATGELAMDKSPKATDRTDLPAVVGRVAAGAYSGGAVAGAPGAAAASVAAALGTYATWRARGLLGKVSGLPDPVIAVGEDILAYGLAAAATRPDPADQPDAAERPVETEANANGGPPPRSAGQPRRRIVRDAGVGLLAGLAGTAAMTIAQGAAFALTGAEPSGTPADTADVIKRRAGRGRLKRRHRPAANHAMHWLYGAAWGIPYGMIAASGDLPPELSGPAFGLLVWGAGLAELPALGVAEPPWKRSPTSLASEALFHVVYGVGAAAAIRARRQK